ncbi:hypothetical protein [Roseibium sp.]|uniref:hypothetical protein n=1 Tax=Roseibium sp. TaxID=1936156 RepID=UPI00351251FB
MSEIVQICKDSYCEICMLKKLERTFKKLDVKERARLLKWMKSYAKDGAKYLDDQKFKGEGRFPSGLPSGEKYTVYAFKAWKIRLYGCFEGKRFLITEIDPAKKQNKADPQKLKNAATRYGEVVSQGRR